jgi:hypothetical protein
MLANILKLIDLFIKLRAVDKKTTKEYFEVYVEPTYELAELVYKDYLFLFDELESKVTSGRKTQPIVRFLEKRRLDNLPIRMKLRALVHARGIKQTNHFEVGILGLMYSTAGSFDSQTNPMKSMLIQERIQYARGGHYLLDIINWIVLSGEDNLAPIRPRLLRLVRKIRSSIDYEWELTVKGYAELKEMIIPKRKRRKRNA